MHFTFPIASLLSSEMQIFFEMFFLVTSSGTYDFSLLTRFTIVCGYLRTSLQMDGTLNLPESLFGELKKSHSF